MPAENYSKNVFINCPFNDKKYDELLWALSFVISDCGFYPRCALEDQDNSVDRFHKIQEIIEECQLGVHDISYTKLDKQNKLPRFNMPLELGLFLGAKRFGGKHHKAKKCLIFERERNTYDKYISDLSGKDIVFHQMKVEKIINEVRILLSHCTDEMIPKGEVIFSRYKSFISQVKKFEKKQFKISYIDFHKLLAMWQQGKPFI